MLRILTPALVLAAASMLQAALWPGGFAGFQKKSARPVAELADKPVWEEYGLLEAEEALYSGPGRTFKAVAYRLKDSTGAMAAAQWLSGSPGAVIRHYNYVLHFAGKAPPQPVLDELVKLLPGAVDSPLPSLPNYLPEGGRVPGSERFVTGPHSLARFLPAVPAEVARFEFGTEAQLCRFQNGGAQLDLALFYYPTPAIARQRLAEFARLPGVRARRSGPLVALVLSAPSPDSADTLLGRVEYEAKLTWSEKGGPKSELARMLEFILNVFIFIGLLVGFALLSGLGVAAFRQLARRISGDQLIDEPFTVLRLHDK